MVCAYSGEKRGKAAVVTGYGCQRFVLVEGVSTPLENFRKIRSSRFRDIQKSVKVQILNEVALIQVVRKRVSFQDRKNKSSPTFPSIKISY